jgi:osmotically-inducible protein OsmY
MANYNRAQRGSRTYWPGKESSSRGSNYGDRYHTGRYSENSEWNENERRYGNESYYPDNARYQRPSYGKENQYSQYGYNRVDSDYRQGNSGSRNSRIPYDRDFDSNYYGNRNTYRGGSYEGGYANSGYDADRFREHRGNWDDDMSYDSDIYRNRRNREDGGYGGTSYNSGNYGAYNRNYNRYRSEDDDQDEDRSWWDKSRDEVSSWFGDDDAERRREQDRLRSGQHRGKGPKGYKRSDERIKEDISDRLGDDPYIDATEVEIVVANGEVTLIGSVNDRMDKRRAEDLAERVSGVKNVENRIRVKSSEGIFENSNKGNASSSVSTTTSGTSRKTSTAEMR